VSVINKMLQDLDARQSGARGAAQLYTKEASVDERRFSPLVIVGAVVGVALLVLGAVAAWRFWHEARKPAAVPRPVAVVIAPAPPRIAPLPAMPVAAPVAPVAVAESVPPPAVHDTVSTNAAPAAPVAPVAHKPAAHGGKPAPAKTDRKRAPALRVAAANLTPDADARADKPGVQGKNETPAQKAESAYRRGLVNLQEGYQSEGIAAMEQALQFNPRHDAARQTLVSVLIESQHVEEAMRQLQTALKLDPKQPSMAMLLARLQIEHGGSGIDTLMQTLPYAAGNGEYHAFLAGALQRQQRHREAIDQYQTALRSLPSNGVWLMGLGISLQAEKRDAEALDAFRKAKASGTLNQQLAGFVDGKIRLLAR
jgi:MSHA biogenesis protein MshN